LAQLQHPGERVPWLDGQAARISLDLDIGRFDHGSPSLDLFAHVSGRLLDRATENLSG
jgi:hypothetical protein